VPGAAGDFLQKRSTADPKTDNLILTGIITILVITSASVVINIQNILMPAFLLFILGFLEGPLLFFALNRLVKAPVSMANRIQKLIVVLFVVNIMVVLFVDLPLFSETGDPDQISGTYGLNAYYFSVFLVCCAGLLMGLSASKKVTMEIAILGHGLIIFIFFLSE